MQEDFSIDTLSLEMAKSRSVFFKKIKSLIGHGLQNLIRDIKMKKAITLLSCRKYNVGDLATWPDTLMQNISARFSKNIMRKRPVNIWLMMILYKNMKFSNKKDSLYLKNKIIRIMQQMN